MNNPFLGLMCFIAALFVGRYINDRAIRKLGEEEQAKISEGLSRYRIISLAGVIAFVVGYFVYREASENEGPEVFMVFALVLVLYLMLGTAFVFIKLKRLAIDENYINNYLLSTAVQYLGLIAYFGFARA